MPRDAHAPTPRRRPGPSSPSVRDLHRAVRVQVQIGARRHSRGGLRQAQPPQVVLKAYAGPAVKQGGGSYVSELAWCEPDRL